MDLPLSDPPSLYHQNGSKIATANRVLFFSINFLFFNQCSQLIFFFFNQFKPIKIQ